MTQSCRPDPMDGLHLALLQQQREHWQSRASFRRFIPTDWVVVIQLLVGIVMGSVAIGQRDQVDSVAMKLAAIMLIGSSIIIWWGLRQTARTHVQKVDAQIAAEARRPDAAVIAEAAIAAREYLLKKRH